MEKVSVSEKDVKKKPKKDAKKKPEKDAKKKLWSKQSMHTRPDGTEVLMDSTWEAALAVLLDRLEIKWDRGDHLVLEYRTPRGRKRKYIPDFFLPDYDIYVEVKGYWTDAARLKVADVQQRHDIKLLILESLVEIGRVEARIQEHIKLLKD